TRQADNAGRRQPPHSFHIVHHALLLVPVGLLGSYDRAPLNWFSGGKVDDAEMEVNSRAFYSPGSVRSGASALTIPAFLAIASSQVEGEPVVSKGKADAEGKIITVFFPPESNPTTGEKFLIYH
ncbi:MAG: hypothetical protein WCP86_00575, partial [bacterium]